MSRCPPGQVEQKKRDGRVSVGADCGDDDVAASERLGTPWYTRGRTAKEGDGAGIGGGRHVGGREAGGGAVTAAERRPGELCRRWSSGGRENRAEEQRVFRGRRREGKRSKGSCVKLKRSRGFPVK
jgi:hypothetical protein